MFLYQTSLRHVLKHIVRLISVIKKYKLKTQRVIDFLTAHYSVKDCSVKGCSTKNEDDCGYIF